MGMLSDFETDAQPVAMKDVIDLVDRFYELREEKSALEKQKAALNEQLDAIEEKLLSHCEALELDQIAGSKAKVSVVNRFSWRVPKTLAEKDELFKYLRERKIFMEMVSVNSQTLNSFCKEEMESAKERGDFMFQVPGVGEPTCTQGLQVRKV
jgi:hypothetical protein